jgi:hypothetical protein
MQKICLSSRVWESYNDLAERLIRLQAAIGFRDLRERKLSRDLNLEVPELQALADILRIADASRPGSSATSSAWHLRTVMLGGSGCRYRRLAARFAQIF